jgi:hypothetical protein
MVAGWESTTLASPQGGAAWLKPARAQPTRTTRGLVILTFASWNQMAAWLRRLEGLRGAA